MIVCPNCGAQVNETARFCRKCGTKIQEPIEREDGSVDFDWDQPVEIEETREPVEIEKPEEPEEEPGKNEDTYDWGPPMGSDREDGSMVPVQFEARRDEIEEYRTDSGYKYDGEGSIPPWDHTHEFDPQDISENKILAMAGYVLGPIGIIIALIASQNSPFAGFHMRQALKFSILEAIVSILMVLLCWTFIVPAAGAIFLIVLLVLRVVAFVSLCRGKAVESPILRNIGFLK